MQSPLKGESSGCRIRPSRVAMKIGEVAQRSGLSLKTIRFYSEEGLIHPIGRSEGGTACLARGCSRSSP